MSDEIMYNQEVTKDMLNDISKDLGNTSFNGFGENKFGADELNGITESLVTKGILMSKNQCRPVVSGDKINIQTGTIVFSNGAKKKITEPVSVDLINGTYVYALNNQTLGICEIRVSNTQPQTGDFVNIASVGADGTLRDTREFAKAKTELESGNVYLSYTAQTPGSSSSSTEQIPAAVAEIAEEEWNYFSYILARDSENFSSFNCVYLSCSEIEFTGKYSDDYEIDPNSSQTAKFRFEKNEEEGKIIIWAWSKQKRQVWFVLA